MTSTEEQFTEHIHSLHDTICSALEEADSVAEFFSDKRKRTGGRGSDMRVMIVVGFL
jgi:coproporphyrinogen III oxidase